MNHHFRILSSFAGPQCVVDQLVFVCHKRSRKRSLHRCRLTSVNLRRPEESFNCFAIPCVSEIIDYRLKLVEKSKMIIFESLLTIFEVISVFEAHGVVEKQVKLNYNMRLLTTSECI